MDAMEQLWKELYYPSDAMNQTMCDRMVVELMPDVTRWAGGLTRDPDEREELVAEGNLASVGGVPRLPRFIKDRRVSTLVRHRVTGAMIDYQRRNKHAPFSDTEHQGRAASEARERHGELCQSLGREATEAEFIDFENKNGRYGRVQASKILELFRSSVAAQSVDDYLARQ